MSSAWKLEFEPLAQKQLRKLDRTAAVRIATHPRGPGPTRNRCPTNRVPAYPSGPVHDTKDAHARRPRAVAHTARSPPERKRQRWPRTNKS